MIRALRWLLIAPMAALGWTIAFVVGLSAATWAFLQTSALSAFIGAFAGGLLTLLVALKCHGRRKSAGYRYRQGQLFI